MAKLSVLFILFLSLHFHSYLCSELMFVLDANDELCFYEFVKEGEETLIEYQVIDGGNLDCDMTLKSPSGKVLYSETQKQYDSHTWTTDEEGIYSWCFSNKFSTFTSKKIYFDFMAGDEPDLIAAQPGAGGSTAMTAMEMAFMSIHESFNVIEDYQKHFRLREMSGQAFAEELSSRVIFWSALEFVVIFVIMVGQVLTVRSFFGDKKNKVPS